MSQGYRQTEIGEIPEEWGVVNLAEVLTSVKNGLTYSQTKDGNGYPVTRIETISDGIIDTSKVGYLNKLDEDEIQNNKLKVGDILFSHINSVKHIAKTAIYLGDPPLLIHGMNLLLMRPNREKIEPLFLFFYFKYNKTRNKFRLMAKKAVNQASINQTEVKSFRLPLPPLPEQQKIAKILSSVDESIQKTDEVIESTQKLKKGLMQQLLTKGIGHTRFKQTEIGEIPEEWEVVRLDEIAEIRRNKTIKDISEIAFIPMELIPDTETYVSYKMLPISEVTSSTYCEEGDILLAKITPSVENSKQGIVPKIPMGFAKATTEVFPIDCKEGISNFFLFYILKFLKFRNILINEMAGSTGRQRVPKDTLTTLLIPLPSPPEQQKIAEILFGVDEKIDVERKRKEKLVRLKKGLMQDLLTGKVRVRT